MTTPPVPTVKQVELITGLFLAGHGLDYVCERGAIGAIPWTRPVVLELVRRQGWDLDGSGRVPRSQRPVPPRPAPPLRPRRPAPAELDGIGEWADGPRPKVTVAAVPRPAAVRSPVTPPPSQSTAPAPASIAKPATRRPPAIPAEITAAVDRFLAERTVDAPADQFLTSPDLRDAYDAWRTDTSAPAATPKSFGIALTSKYSKKQAPSPINGVKPICYFGIAWKPTSDEQSAATSPSALGEEPQTPTEGTASETEASDAAGTAPDPSGSGHGIAGPDAQPQVSPFRSHAGKDGELGASDASAEPPVALSDRQLEVLAPIVSPDDWTWNPAEKCYELRADADPSIVPTAGVDQGPPEPDRANADVSAAGPVGGGEEPAPSPVTSVGMQAHQVDLLALGLAHPDPKIRAKAARVLAVVDDLCNSLARRRT